MLFEREAFKKVINYKYDGPGPSGPEKITKVNNEIESFGVSVLK